MFSEINENFCIDTLVYQISTAFKSADIVKIIVNTIINFVAIVIRLLNPRAKSFGTPQIKPIELESLSNINELAI